MFVPQEEVTLKRSLSLAWSQRSLCQDLWPLPSPFQRAAADSKNLENRMKEMDENLATQHRQTVKEALKNVRTLTPRPTLVSPGVLFAALKTYQVFWYFTLQSVFYIQYEFGDKVLYFFCWDCKESGQETSSGEDVIIILSIFQIMLVFVTNTIFLKTNSCKKIV